MRLFLLLALTACGTDASADSHTDKPLCHAIDDDMTYLNEYPMAPCELYLGATDYHLFTSPFDPGGDPFPILLDGWERDQGGLLVKASNAPVVKVRDDVYTASAVLHDGQRGRAVALDERIERCEWVQCR